VIEGHRGVRREKLEDGEEGTGRQTERSPGMIGGKNKKGISSGRGKDNLQNAKQKGVIETTTARGTVNIVGQAGRGVKAKVDKRKGPFLQGRSWA